MAKSITNMLIWHSLITFRFSMDGYMDRLKVGWMNRWMDGWMDGWMVHNVARLAGTAWLGEAHMAGPRPPTRPSCAPRSKLGKRPPMRALDLSWKKWSFSDFWAFLQNHALLNVHTNTYNLKLSLNLLCYFTDGQVLQCCEMLVSFACWTWCKGPSGICSEHFAHNITGHRGAQLHKYTLL